MKRKHGGFRRVYGKFLRIDLIARLARRSRK